MYLLAERRGGKRFDPSEPASPVALARALHGDDVIIRPHGLIGARPAATGWLKGAPRILVRRTTPLELLGFFICHELAHIELGTVHNGDPELEAACDFLAACLMAPSPAIEALFREFGWNLKAIAEEVVSTQTWAALRLAERLNVPLAAVSPDVVRVRGPEEHVWPDEPTLRRWVVKPGPGVRKVRVTDRPRRALLVAED